MNILQTKTIWTKISGAGNRFWIAYFSPSFFPYLEKGGPRVARALCRTNQVEPSREKNSADGAVIILPTENHNFKWLFYNMDGSLAEMCGNAACCVTDYVFKNKLIPLNQSSFLLETKAGKIKGELFKDSARIFLERYKNIQGPFDFSWQGEKIQYMFINSSVPHAVIKLQNWPNSSSERAKNWKLKKNLAKLLRKSSKHHKNGMNVSFYSLKKTASEGKSNKSRAWLFARSFERGVEDFTRACGTGALAVAEAHRLKHTSLQSVFVKMPGGLLKVGFHSENKISLMSPVKWIEEKEM